MTDYERIKNLLAPLNPEFVGRADDSKKFISVKSLAFGFSSEGYLQVVQIHDQCPLLRRDDCPTCRDSEAANQGGKGENIIFVTEAQLRALLHDLSGSIIAAGGNWDDLASAQKMDAAIENTIQTLC